MGEQVLSGVRVLIVDDDVDTREVLTLSLTLEGADVTAVGTADQALDAFAARHYDVVVSDIFLPGLDGYALIRTIRSLAPERGGRIPALALTACARLQDRLDAFAAGFQDHISKPVDQRDLIVAISRLTGRTTLHGVV